MNTSVRRVLLVDDDHDIRGAVADGLRQSGWSVIVEVDEQAALNRLRDSPLEKWLVLVDLGAAGADRYRFVDQLRACRDPASLSVIVTATSVDLDRLPAEVRFLRKPINADALLYATRSTSDATG